MQNEITIIGAGIGSLTLAKSLEQKSIPFQLYEKYQPLILITGAVLVVIAGGVGLLLPRFEK